MNTQTLAGMPVIVSPLCLERPKPGEEARRIVRHGLASVLSWLGEDVGPLPDEPVPAAFVMGRHMVMHPSIRNKLLTEYAVIR